MANSVLNVESLNVEFNMEGNYFHAVRDVSFKIEPGETLGLVGESGCGKSVTSLALVRLLTQSARVTGKIEYQGKNLLELPERDMRDIRGNEISMIFQEPMTSLNPVYKIGAQISETLLLHKDISPREAFQQSLEMLKKVGIPRPEDIMDEYPHQLSGGMRQRIMIAIAMACNPKLLIADEPTTALDVTIQAQILELMKGISKDLGTSILLITHDLGVVAEMCDRVAVMYAGQIVEQGSVDDIFFNPQHPYTRGLLNAIPKIDAEQKQRLQPIEGNVPPITRMPKGCRFSPRCMHASDRCRAQQPGFFQVDNAEHLSRCWLNEAKEA
ncbi:ABC transporter ATP-binding protein [Alicyclobacillus sp. TC]|uniref:Oligopeptide/dipeptide ABC transporter ATP-binding protein n=1 Tax=Alicyclobacillus tolerans TaxID=90970 RepID=A0ABT9LXT8_9BACL|nr:oligopeptide/dipeptide ABC transporter ATP-binding protein [Alicyclobacillus tengchongensis]